MLDAVALALDRHGVQFEIGDPDNAVQSVFVQAPDLVLLVGDASAEEGRVMLEKLSATVATAVIPVAILADDAGLDHRLAAARLGAVALIPRSASADAMAKLIADVAREHPAQKTGGATDLGEATLDEVVQLFARRLRSGILAVSANGGSERVVLRGDRPVTQAIEELVERLRPLVTQSETVHWEFQQASTGKLAELTLDDDEPSGEVDIAALFRERRIVIVEKSPARADDLVVALRERGAHVVVIDGEGTGLVKARAIDPDVILVDVSGVGGWAGQAMQLIRNDSRLRWAALLVTRGEELWRANTPEPDIARLAAGMLPLVEPDESLMERVRDGKTAIDVRLETTGPTRLLRAVARAGVTVHATVRHRRATIEIDFAQGLIVGARGEVASETPGSPPSKVEGTAALAVWLGIGSGRVRIERREAPSVANVMSPVDDAIAAADRETPLLAPSIPPPAGPPSLGPPRPAAPSVRPSPSGETDARVLVHQLETLLDRLRHTLPPGALEVPSETASAKTQAPAARKDATPVVNPLSGLPEKVPARLPAPPAKPQVRRVTQMGMPVPAHLRPAPVAGPPPPKRPIVPAPASVLPRSSEAAFEPPAPPPPPAQAVPTHAVVTAKPAVVALPPPMIPRAFDDEAPTSKRAALSEDEPASNAQGAGVTDLGALLDAQLLASPVSTPPQPPTPVTTESEPPISIPVTPLEATDQIALPAYAEPDAEMIAPPSRSRTGTWVVLGLATLVAMLCLGVAVAWRVGMFTPATPIATQLTPTPSIVAIGTLPPPPTAVVLAPPTTVAIAPTSVVVTPPLSTVVDAVPPPSVAGLVPPPTDEIVPPPTTLVIAPPPSSVVEVVTPPPPTSVEEEDGPEEEHGHPDPSLRPDDPQRLVDRANFRRTHGDLPGAEADYLHVLRIAPNNARAQAGLARVHLARHDARTASTWARRLAEGHTPNAGNYVLLGDTLQATGDAASARRAWEHALEITPSYRDARRRLGR